jgi:hypothetical protein
MSKFSGKCDFYDEIEIFGLDKILMSQVYVGESEVPLVLRTYEDCIPYFPHIITMSVYDNAAGRNVIRLSERSWVDIEERRYGKTPMHDYYRKLLKEEKEKYNV